jgi:hypothetical protein
MKLKNEFISLLIHFSIYLYMLRRGVEMRRLAERHNVPVSSARSTCFLEMMTLFIGGLWDRMGLLFHYCIWAYTEHLIIK